MLGGNKSNAMLPAVKEENHFQYQNNASNQLQLFGNLTAGCSLSPVNYLGNEHDNFMLLPNKQNMEVAEDISRQRKLQVTFNYNTISKNVADHCIPRPNLVSTGLRLSYDDEEPNSSVTSASGSVSASPSIIFSLGDGLRAELEQQKEEFEQYVKLQQEQLVKGVRDMKQRHTASFLSVVEEGIAKKLLEKDVEMDTLNRKNRELVERVKQAAAEAQSWHYRAKYNESVVHMLQNNLQQAMSQGVGDPGGKEGFGDSELDDAASFADPRGGGGGYGVGVSRPVREVMMCRACGVKEVSMLVMPCRHLCLCRECGGFLNVCPVCHSMKSACIQVHMA